MYMYVLYTYETVLCRNCAGPKAAKTTESVCVCVCVCDLHKLLLLH